MQDLSPWQPPHSGILCCLTLTAPQCPFFQTNLKLSLLRKHFYNVFTNFNNYILDLRLKAFTVLKLFTVINNLWWRCLCLKNFNVEAMTFIVGIM